METDLEKVLFCRLMKTAYLGSLITENMKKDILTALILLFFSVLTTTAQPTLSSNNNPLVGESYFTG